MRPVELATLTWQGGLAEAGCPVDLDRLVEGAGSWEVEIGSGKGRYVLARAAAEPETRFLAIEVAAKYHRLLRDRMRRHGVPNLLAVHGEALYLMSAALPRSFARAVHVYFPDPWPKSRHHKRRLFDAETVDLVFGLLEPAGRLYFATDHPDYGEVVTEVLSGHPGLRLAVRPGPWDGGPRTNYEAKYEREGRPILRLEAERLAPGGELPLHPQGEAAVIAAPCPPE